MYVVYEMGAQLVLIHGLFTTATEAIEYIRYCRRNGSLTFEFVEIISPPED